MPRRSTNITLPDPEATGALARRLAVFLEPGDTLLMSGEIGAGKTFFARELLSEILPVPEDIPSPTFTIVQAYETTRGDVWHVDLYRLETKSEVVELGLLEAFSDMICLVEWPDRLGDMAPDSALNLAFSSGMHEEDRNLLITWQDTRWDSLMNEIADD
ncbi:tRNA (adenosine(37)-N6)-threonylcarbamoyltransferase complex ATPase subunit type 1 TsaE [Roseovarius rhodophyticola]|uniref:tRNA threonylcarbamoyladenosine biosynthesis protein TsaE n=1 Tax=Roseovarius rhodophyticola TaxID=3080827 RepID=A0ABZ2TJB8_9RHOB|nr:tRNA (adenosine(37)-N6)-threonylcarbamoyltransferase complex ATPase subunit type 1 TsaE [Roseovarius sp. W115]MDV2930029.1 tRNA (adenosine(37)-N6)-threonylcarbamoyltransferase complex ATPase subunit type 1 TsaE [Roseovarius sp. W115]